MSKHFLSIAFSLLVLITLTSCTSIQEQASFGKEQDNYETVQVSIYSLLSNPNDYNGIKVRVTGVLDVVYEGNALYADSESFRNGISMNAITLGFNPDEIAKGLGADVIDLYGISGYIATVEGVFIASPNDPVCAKHIGSNGNCVFIGTKYAGRLVDVVHLSAKKYEKP
jgi:hypothetical protein